jgi:hypothetical protein
MIVGSGAFAIYSIVHAHDEGAEVAVRGRMRYAAYHAGIEERCDAAASMRFAERRRETRTR